MKPNPYSRKPSQLKAEINVVPYIDVMLVLLVIFMVTTPMMTTGIDVDLPKENTKNLNVGTQLPIIVSMTIGSELYLSNEEGEEQLVTETELTQTLLTLQESTDAGQELKVMLQADTNIPYGSIMTLMAHLQQAGIVKVGLITNPQA